jgi:cytoskeleton protein RodZ
VETLGQEFKRKREERKVSLKEVAEETRVGVRFLQAIEADDFAALPGGVYTRSFIRTYAKYLGLDEEDILARYRKYEVVVEEPDEPMKNYKEFSNDSNPISLWVGLVVLLALIGGGTYGILQYLNKNNFYSQVSNTPTPTIETPTPTPITSATPSPTPAIEKVVLTLKTSKGESWVSVLTDDEVKPKILIVPSNSSKDFEANDKLKVTIGNLPVVQLEINGQPAKLPNNGLTVKEAVITKENYQTYIAAALTPVSNITTPRPVSTPAVGGVSNPTPGASPAATPATIRTPRPTSTPGVNTTNPSTPNATPAIKKPVATPTGENSTGVSATPKPKPPTPKATSSPIAGESPKPRPTSTAGATPNKPANTATEDRPKPKPTASEAPKED